MDNDRYAYVNGVRVRRIMGGTDAPPAPPPAVPPEPPPPAPPGPTQADLDKERAENLRLRLTVARHDALAQFPKANKELLEMFPATDPDAITAFAKKLHETAPDPVQPPALGAQPAPPPAPAPAPGDVPQPGVDQAHARIRELQGKLNDGSITMDEAGEAQDLMLRYGWNLLVSKSRQMAGSYSLGGDQ